MALMGTFFIFALKPGREWGNGAAKYFVYITPYTWLNAAWLVSDGSMNRECARRVAGFFLNHGGDLKSFITLEYFRTRIYMY